MQDGLNLSINFLNVLKAARVLGLEKRKYGLSVKLKLVLACN